MNHQFLHSKPPRAKSRTFVLKVKHTKHPIEWYTIQVRIANQKCVWFPICHLLSWVTERIYARFYIYTFFSEIYETNMYDFSKHILKFFSTFHNQHLSQNKLEQQNNFINILTYLQISSKIYNRHYFFFAAYFVNTFLPKLR